MLIDSLVQFALLGSTWVLYLLLALSVLSVAAMAERWAFFLRNSRGASSLRAHITHAVETNDEDAVLAAVAAGRTVEASVLRDALRFLPGGASAVLDAVESGLGRERVRLEKAMTLLGTLGNNTPFVGLFGTVLGVIEAFSHLGGGDQGQMGNVMSAIAEALVATGVGIFVAIPAVVAYNVAQSKVEAIETEVTSLAKLLTAWITTRERVGPRRLDARWPEAHTAAVRPPETRPDDTASGDLALRPDQVGASR